MPSIKKKKPTPVTKLTILAASVMKDGKLKVKVATTKQFYTGQLIEVNGNWFRVHSTLADSAILAPFKMHEQVEHNPLEKPAIKKEWVKALVTAHQKEGTTHEDIEFMEDVFQDTPVEPNEVELVKLLPSEAGPPVVVKEDYTPGMSLEENPSLMEQVPGIEDQTGKGWAVPFPLGADSIKVMLYGGGGSGGKESPTVPSVQNLPKYVSDSFHELAAKKVKATPKSPKLKKPPSDGKILPGGGLVFDLPPKGESLFSDPADPALKEIANQIDEYAIGKALEPKLKIRVVKSIPPTTLSHSALLKMLSSITGFSMAGVKVAVTGKLWMPVVVDDLSQYAELISDLEQKGVVFSISES